MLEVCIVHGSLEQASHPVAVGHCQGMPLSGAEGALDRVLGGALATRHFLGLYPEQEGTASLVRSGSADRVRGALILGLGPPGEVTALKVSRAMTRAAVLWALAAAEEAGAMSGAAGARGTRPSPLTVGISSVLVGANPLDGLPVDAAVAALIDGVTAAIHLLRSAPRLSKVVHIGTLEIVERYAVRAEQARHALTSIKDRTSGRGRYLTLRPNLEVTTRAGAEPGLPDNEYNANAWWRVDIRAAQGTTKVADGYRNLEFTSISRGARADRLTQSLETTTVDGLIAEAVRQTQSNPQICNTLWELLLPPELKYDFETADNLQLVLDPAAAGYPWEALAGPQLEAGEAPLALRVGVLRRFAEAETRKARFLVRRPIGNQVLVIGNPPGGEGVPDLPGASAEAAAVVKALGQVDGVAAYTVRALTWADGEVTSLCLPPADAGAGWCHIMNALFQHEYRIVHIASHGVFDPSDPAHSGVLIGPGQFLTAQTVGQLPVVPELVFLNCCHAGSIGVSDTSGGSATRSQAHVLAASIARSLMDIGVRAVVAAGWAVGDKGASAFATTFYDQMLNHSARFGGALLEARRAAQRAETSMTWAAYQCYGDPGFALATSEDAEDASNRMQRQIGK